MGLASFASVFDGPIYATAFRRKLYRSLEELQADVDIWVKDYNEQRTHSGKHCFGKTPMQTFIDSRHLALEKQLDRTMQDPAPLAATA